MAFSVGYTLGSWVGAFVLIAIIAAITERLAFRTMDPLRRAQFTVGTAFLLAAVIAGFGNADGGPFAWQAGLDYVPGAIVTFVWYYNRYKKAWSPDSE